MRSRLQVERLESRELMASGIPAAWFQRGAGGGGALFSPAINPANPNDLYIASDMSQVFNSTDNGVSWKVINHHELQGGHQAKVLFTSDPNIRYALDYTDLTGGGTRILSKTTDGGNTWTRLSTDPTGGDSFYLFVDPNSTQRILVSDYTHLYYSGNGGTSWSTVYTTTDTSSGVHVGGVFWDGSNIYAGTSKGLLVSNNGLTTGFQTSSATGIPTNQAILSFSGAKSGTTTRFFAVTKDASTVYSGTQGWDYGDNGSQSIYAMDVGQNWSLRMNGFNSANVEGWFVGTSTNNINVAYVAGGGIDGLPTVYRTTDGGLNWTNSFLTTNNQNIITGWSGHQGDRQWSYGEMALGFTVSSSDPNRAIITDYGFAHITTDGGATWKQLYVNPADQNPAGSNTPKGRSYRSSGLENTTGWQVTWADANTMMIGNSDVRMQRSTNAGTSFGFGYTGNNYNSTYRYAVHPTTGVIYAATSSVHDLYQSTYLQDSRIDGGTGSVLFSTDKGATWQTMKDFGKVVSWVALDPTNPTRMYASVVNSNGSGFAGGIYVSNNINLGAASTWTKVANPPRTEGHAFNIVVLNDGSIVATYSGRRNTSGAFTASSGVFYSTDGGTTWQDRSASGMQYWTKDVVVDPYDTSQNTWYAGVWSGWGGPPNGLGGLYKSTNRGQSWTRITSGLDRVTSITFNPTDQNEAWVTTETQGLWYTNNIRSASPTFQDVMNFGFRQPERVFYNPFNTSEIWISTFGGGVWKGDLSQAGSLQLTSSSYSVNENGGTITLTVQRVGGSSGAASVSIATSNGSAISGQDYVNSNGTLNWADGDANPKTFTISILNDSFNEPTEAFNVTLSNANGATLGTPTTATVTITDDDPLRFGEVHFRQANYTIGESGGSIILEVERVNGSDGAVSITFGTANGSALSGSDYTTTSGTLSWAAGDSTIKTITVPILNNTANEPTESFTVVLSNPQGGVTLNAPSTAIVTINDDDALQFGEVHFRQANYTTSESGGNMVLEVERINGSDGAVSISFATANGSALSGSDYTTTSGTLSWTAGESSVKTITIPILNDVTNEPLEAFTVALSNPQGGVTLSAPSVATVNITDDDALQFGEVHFRQIGYTISESSGNIVLEVERINGSDGAVSISFATANGSALSGSDYTTTSGSLSWTAGDASVKTITVPILNNTTSEPTESFTVVLSNPQGGVTLNAPSTATVTINDDDAQQFGEVHLRQANYTIGESGGSLILEVERVNGSDGAVTIDFGTMNGTATSGSDYTTTTGTLSWAAGDSSVKTITIPILNDATTESTETFTLQLSNPTGGVTLGSPSTATITIQDDDVNQGTVFQRVVVGGGEGLPPELRIIDGANGNQLFAIQAYSANYRGGVRVAVADLNRDGVPDFVTTPGLGASAADAGWIRVFDGSTGLPMVGVWNNGVKATDTVSGLFVATADINKDGVPDVITGNDSGSLPIVHVYDGATARLFTGSKGTFRAFSGSLSVYFRGGVRVAAGDVNGDGRADIIAGTGNGSSQVAVYSLAGSGPSLIRSFTSFSNNTSGVFVAATDTNGDGKADIIVGSGQGGEARIYKAPGKYASLKPFGASWTGAVRVAVGDINGDGKADLLFAQGSVSSPKVRLYDAGTLNEFFAGSGPLSPFGSATGGLFVSAAR